MKKYVKVKNTLNLRDRPKTGVVLAELKDKSEVDVIHECSGWAHVKYKNIQGYVSSEFLVAPGVRDKVTAARIEHLHPKIKDEVTELVIKAEQGLDEDLAIRIVQGFRSFAEQNALYAKGRTKPGPIVTNAKGGQSYHNYGLAIDFAILVDKDGNGTYDELSWDIRKDNDTDGTADWIEVVNVFEAAGYKWGGKWASIKDYPHLQKTFGFSWETLLAKYNQGNTFEENGNTYVKI